MEILNLKHEAVNINYLNLYPENILSFKIINYSYNLEKYDNLLNTDFDFNKLINIESINLIGTNFKILDFSNLSKLKKLYLENQSKIQNLILPEKSSLITFNLSLQQNFSRIFTFDNIKNIELQLNLIVLIIQGYFNKIIGIENLINVEKLNICNNQITRIINLSKLINLREIMILNESFKYITLSLIPNIIIYCCEYDSTLPQKIIKRKRIVSLSEKKITTTCYYCNKNCNKNNKLNLRYFSKNNCYVYTCC